MWKEIGARGKQGGAVGERETKGQERVREKRQENRADSRQKKRCRGGGKSKRVRRGRREV